jgi:Uncharacterized conserved protein (COG2071)
VYVPLDCWSASIKESKIHPNELYKNTVPSTKAPSLLVDSPMLLLHRHPFPVVAFFEKVLAVSFAFPEGVVRALVPDGLEIDGYNGFGFVTVALVWTRRLRPAGFPAFLGRDFFLAGYRVFTRLREPSGRRLRGILRSETDSHRMVWMGNWLTRYNYRYVNVTMRDDGSEKSVETARDDGTQTLFLSYDADGNDAPLPEGSPFPDWHTARLFAGPMPFTFSPEADGRFVVIEGRRTEWVPRPVRILKWDVSLFHESPLRDAEPILANAFVVENVNYRWEKGRIVRPGSAS